jgi:gamma-glutamyl-gamma-aminobutyrate hydrolase PuuD
MTLAADIKKREQDALAREVFDLRVFVVGGGFPYIKMLYEAGFKGAKDLDEADIICFTGGEDVNPSLYNEEAINGTHFNASRDDHEAMIYGYTLKKPKIGICRGAQFLNVMNGGRLWQDVNNHACAGHHDVTDVKTGEIIQGMTSTHHQQMIPADDAEIVATAALSTVKRAMSSVQMRNEPENDDMEVLWYPDTLSLCFQPHPEFRHGPCRNYFLDLVDNYILPAC